MTEQVAETVDCPSCKFTYKKLTPFQTLVRACPACGAAAPGAEPKKSAPEGASRYIPKIPTGMVPKTSTDEAQAKKAGSSHTVETAAAATAAGGVSPPMATPPPRAGPFTAPAVKPGEVEVPVCFGDGEVFRKGEFCPTCEIFDKCFRRVLIITLRKLAGGSSGG